MIHSIAHPTDFSDLSGKAFAHALRIAVAAKSMLHVLHVVERDKFEADAFPQVRAMLAQWGLIDDDEPSPAIATKLGIRVSNVRLEAHRPVDGITSFLDRHATDLVVLGTHGRGGLERLLAGSVAETLFRRSRIPTLFVGSGTREFVRQISGDLGLRRILVPVDHSPAPAPAVEAVRRFAQTVAGGGVTVLFLHVGKSAPVIQTTSAELEVPDSVILRSGNVVESILSAADEFDADLIGMPTAGQHGVFDAVRGSTTERVLRRAPCPVLAIPA
jgi:nucleotide-binding universal stress UspA family protein